MDGLIVLNKPIGITSAKALYRVRKLTGQKKSGHAGTLDPAAEGVLILCQGKATKLVEQLMGLSKGYRAAARLDVTSDSLDSDSPLIPVPVATIPTRVQFDAALHTFIGVTEQVPPAISALKIGGTPAYKLTRKGKPPTLTARPVRIYSAATLAFDWPAVSFEIRCGRGTYVRSLIRDIGARLGTGGCLTGLVRTATGPFTIDRAVGLDELTAENVAARLIPLDTAVEMIRGAVENAANSNES